MAWTQAGEKNRVATLAFDPALLLRAPARTASAGPAPAFLRRGPPAALEFCDAPSPADHAAAPRPLLAVAR
jgi:hypothetical protein